MEFGTSPYIVYVKTDAENRILEVNSSDYLQNIEGWMEIDSGYDDRYHHAQANYFDKPIMDDRGIWRYKIVTFVDWPEGKIIQEFFYEGEEYGVFERTQEEMDAEAQAQLAPDNRIAALEEQLAAYEAAYLEGVNEA